MKKFSCHGCAGCCHGSISLTYQEAMHDFSGDFPLIVAFVVSDVRNVPVENDKGAYSKGMKKFTKDVIGFYGKTKTSRKIVIHPQILTLFPADTPCINLDEYNLCKIYDRKPSVCTLYPVRFDTPISWIEEGLARERNNSYEGEAYIPCKGWTDDAPIIYANGKPSDDGIIPLLLKRNLEFKPTRDSLRQYYNHIRETEENSRKIEEYSKLNDQSGRLLQFNFSNYIEFMVNHKGMHEHIAKVAIRGQVNQLGLALNKLSNRSDDVANTYKDMYNRYIKESENILMAL